MKNNSLTRITAIVLLITMFALVIISGTFAKYTEQYAGDSTAIVAKWVVDITGLDDQPLTETTTFNLFDVSKVYDLDGVTNVNDLSVETGTDDLDVANGTDKGIVAPGTWGKVGFKIAIGEANDVTVKYGVYITDIVNANNIPLEFSVDGQNWKSATEIKTLTTKTVNPRNAVSDTVTLYWRWLYENGTDAELKTNDGKDTTLGEAGTATCKMTATFGATQID